MEGRKFWKTPYFQDFIYTNLHGWQQRGLIYKDICIAWRTNHSVWFVYGMEGNVFLVVQIFSQQWKIASTSWHFWYYSCHLVLWLHPKWFVISLFYTAMYMYLHIYITCIIYIFIYCIPAGLVYDHCVSQHVRNHPALLMFLVTWQLLVWWWPCPIHHLAAEWRCTFLFYME